MGGKGKAILEVVITLAVIIAIIVVSAKVNLPPFLILLGLGAIYYWGYENGRKS